MSLAKFSCFALDNIAYINLRSMSDNSNIWIHVYFSIDHFMGTSVISAWLPNLLHENSLLGAQVMHLSQETSLCLLGCVSVGCEWKLGFSFGSWSACKLPGPGWYSLLRSHLQHTSYWFLDSAAGSCLFSASLPTQLTYVLAAVKGERRCRKRGSFVFTVLFWALGSLCSGRHGEPELQFSILATWGPQRRRHTSQPPTSVQLLGLLCIRRCGVSGGEIKKHRYEALRPCQGGVSPSGTLPPAACSLGSSRLS